MAQSLSEDDFTYLRDRQHGDDKSWCADNQSREITVTLLDKLYEEGGLFTFFFNLKFEKTSVEQNN